MELAIKGHTTRGTEVIALLEMLGGINVNNLYGDDFYYYYYITDDKEIDAVVFKYSDDETCIFSLEEFEEKYPYMVGDKVLYKTYGIYSKIKSMCWNKEKEQVFYRLDSKNFFVATVDELKPYKQIKETMKEKIQTINLESEEFADKVGVMMGNYEVEVKDGITFFIKKQPQYPKTYNECCKVLFPNTIELGKVSTHGYNGKLLEKFGELLICRDAYWKIAGKQMGLGKHWESNPSNEEQHRYAIYNYEGAIEKNDFWQTGVNAILSFPTEEMRDAFFENFKELIEECKELL